MFGGTVKVTPLGIIVFFGTVGVLLFLYVKSDGESKGSASETSRVNLKTLVSVSLKAVEEAGIEIQKIHEAKKPLNEKSKGRTKEGAKQLVTDADKRSHAIIVGKLGKLFPGLKLISEECETDDEADTVKSAKSEVQKIIVDNVPEGLPDVEELLKDVVVWVDPLDATQEFTEDLLKYVTVMICIVVKGKPVVGIIRQPFASKTTWGWQGYVTPKIQERSSSDKSSKHKKIVVSRSHAGHVRDVVSSTFGNDTEVLPQGGSGFKTLLVLGGEADAYVHVTAISKWDVCAPNALLLSAKGKMTSLDGSLIDYGATSSPLTDKGIIATLRNHPEYVAALKNAKTKS